MGPKQRSCRRLRAFALAGAAFLGLAGFASAADAGTVTFLTIDHSTYGSQTSTSGSGDGNSRTFSAGGLTMTATGWSTTSTSQTSATRTAGYLGLYEYGLGVTSGPEPDGGNNRHTVDNYYGFDFVQMMFSEQVKILSVTIVPFAVKEPSPDHIDRDITVSFGDWKTSTRSSYYGPSGTTPYYITHELTGNTTSSQLNVFAHLFGSSSGQTYDGFKIAAITVETIGTVAVPLPPAVFLGMALMGGAGAFGAWRRKRRRRELAD